MSRSRAEEIERVRSSVNLADVIASTWPLRRQGQVFVALCPFHTEKTPSFKVNPSRGRFYCFGCGAHGDVIDWLQRREGLGFRQAIAKLARGQFTATIKGTLRLVVRNADHDSTGTHRDTLIAREVWRSATSITGTVAENYLRWRGIKLELPPSLRFLPVFNFRGGFVCPAMVAAVQSPSSGEIIALQATALKADGRKADLPKDKVRHTLGPLARGAVRLAAAGSVLGLAEGAEDALAAIQLTDVPTWASLGAQRMDQLSIPNSVRELHIFTDDDEAGREAAKRTAEAHRHLRCIIRLPPVGFKDWGQVVAGKANLG